MENETMDNPQAVASELEVKIEGRLTDSNAVIGVLRAIKYKNIEVTDENGHSIDVSPYRVFGRGDNVREYVLEQTLLPDHMSSASLKVVTEKQVSDTGIVSFPIVSETYIIGFKGKLDHQLQADHWESLGYTTQNVKQSLQVIEPDGKLVATYGKNRVKVSEDRLDTYLRNTI